MTHKNVQKTIRGFKNDERAVFHQAYFKTEKGGYGEGDIFVGLNAAQLAIVTKQFVSLPRKDIEQLLKSKIHEDRSVALSILELQFVAADEKNRKKLVDFYLKHTSAINNWDLVDSSAPYILGWYLFDKDKAILYKLVKSKNVWEKRIAIIATQYFIRQGKFADTLKLSKILLNDPHPLIHKAVGWMLREVGKKSKKTLEDFLDTNYAELPRTTLRYAIERFPETQRKAYLKRSVRKK